MSYAHRIGYKKKKHSYLIVYYCVHSCTVHGEQRMHMHCAQCIDGRKRVHSEYSPYMIECTNNAQCTERACSICTKICLHRSEWTPYI